MEIKTDINETLLSYSEYDSAVGLLVIKCSLSDRFYKYSDLKRAIEIYRDTIEATTIKPVYDERDCSGQVFTTRIDLIDRYVDDGFVVFLAYHHTSIDL